MSDGDRRSIETVIIGAGQAGLMMSWHLLRAGREHVVLERRDTLGGQLDAASANLLGMHLDAADLAARI